MAQQMTRTILEEFVDQHRGSLALFNREAQVVPGGVTHDARAMHPFTLFVRGAEGACKWDVDGHRLIDYIMGHGALLLGHAHPATVEAVREQIGHGTHYGAGHELEIAWSELVCSLVPSAERVQFTSSGTEATMLAMRLARAFTGKNTIVKFAGHFHGWHDYATAGVQPPYDVPTSLGVPPAVLASVVVAPPNDLAFVEQTLAENGDVAAVILEASGASWSTLPLPAGFLAELRALTERHGVLLIMDEVINGFGRTGKWFATEHFGVVPDIMTMAKGLSSGYAPIAAAIVRPGVFDVFKEGENALGHLLTFGGQAVAAAAALKNIEVMRREGLVERAAEQGAYLLDSLKSLVAGHPTVGDARGIGLLCAIELVKDKESKEKWGKDSPFAKRVGELINERGLLSRVWDICHVAPPLVVSREEIDRIVTIIDDSLTVAEREFGVAA